MDEDEHFACEHQFLFGEPNGFFNSIDAIAVTAAALKPSLLAFKSNLSSAILIGNVPFYLTQASVTDQRFHQLLTAERIRSRSLEGTETFREEAAFLKASERMTDEMRNPDIVGGHAKRTLKLLDRHLANGEFSSSSEELLRQVLVIGWSAFEVLVNDTLRLLINVKPSIISAFTDIKPYRESLSGRALLEALNENQFDLSARMGDIFCEIVRLDSLEKIRDAIRLSLQNTQLDARLKDEKLWRISQQRHLIVHRRGLVDSRYVERTSDRINIGEHIKFDSNYVETSLSLIRDIGCEVFEAAQKELSTAPSRSI